MRITGYATDFYRGYVTATLWANTYDAETEEPLEHGSGEFVPGGLLAMLDEEAERQMFGDSVAFVVAEWADLKDLPAEQSGHDFALTRNGHGSGYWDRGYGDVGERLSKASKAWGDFSLYKDGDSIGPM